MTHDPVDLDTARLREAERQKLLLRQKMQEAEDFNWIMGDEKGRRFVWGILQRAGLFSLSYNGTGEDAIRAIAVTNEARLIMGMIFAYCPQKLAEMVNEREKDDDDDRDATI